MNERLANVIIHYHKRILVVFFLITAVLAWQALNFKVDASAQTLLTKGNKLYLKTQIMNERFSPQEFLLIGYQPHNKAVLSQHTFNNIEALSKKLKTLERVESVRSIVNVPLLSLAGGKLDTSGSIEKWTIENHHFTPKQLKKTLANHPIYQGLIINKAQSATALQVLFKPNPKLAKIHAQITHIQAKKIKGKLSSKDQQKLQRLQKQAAPIEQRLNKQRNREIKKIQAIVKPYKKDANIYLGGAHVLGYQLIHIIKSDLVIFGSAIAVIICLVLFFVFRRLRWVLIPVICCVASVTCTIGLFGCLGFKATVISSNFIALQIILTLAIVIHLIVQYREYAASEPNWSQNTLISRTFTRKATPCFYAGLTTSIGFASLLFTGIAPVIAFGWMMIIAMSVSIAVSLLLFPAILSLLHTQEPPKTTSTARAFLDGFTHLAIYHGRATVVASIIILAVAIAGLFFLNVENSFINYFRDSTQTHKELTFIDQELGGSTPLQLIYTLPAPQKGKKNLIMSAAVIQKAQLIQAALSSHKGVGKTLSVVNFTELGKKINMGKPLTEYELTALYWSMNKSLRETLIGSYYNKQHSQLRISARIQDSTQGLNRADLIKSIRADMKKLNIPKDHYVLTDLFVLYQNILQKLFTSQILSLGIVYVFLTLIFWLIFRSFKIALIAIVPNILSTVAVLGFMGWLGISLNLMTITIASIAMGIAVDDTIHYIHRYREEVKNHNQTDAIKRSHSSVGYAVLYTSALVMLGFAMLMFSDFVPSIQFGLLTCLAMFMALVADLTLLPVLLKHAIKPASEHR